MAETNLQVEQVFSSEIEQLRKFFEHLEKLMEEKAPQDDETVLLRELNKKFRGLSPHAAQTVVRADFAEAIKKDLIEKRVPFAAVPDSKGDFIFTVHRSDADKLFAAQTKVYQVSTEYAKELTPENMLRLHRQFRSKSAKVMELDKAEASTIKSKLFASGIVFASLDVGGDKETLVFSPGAEYSASGNDLAKFELLKAYEKAKDPEDRKVSEAQAKYDSDVLNAFISNADKGAVLKGDGGMELKKTDGEYVFFDGKSKTPLDVRLGATQAEIEIALSKPAEQMVNKIVEDSNGKPLFEELRPVLEDKKRAGSYNSLKATLEEVNKAATDRVNKMAEGQDLSPAALLSKKREEIGSILAARENPSIVTFLKNVEGGGALLDAVAAAFASGGAQSKKVSELLKAAKGPDEKEAAPERESEQPEREEE